MLFVNSAIDHYIKMASRIILIIVHTFMLIWLIYAIYPTKTPIVTIPLEGAWKISLEDNRIFASAHYDDSPWETIQIPGSIIDYSLRTKNAIKGVCWLRKTVNIGNTDLPLGISLGRIANADETYLNNEKIGSTGRFPPDELSMWNYPRNYTMPEQLINRNGPNTIAIRVSYYVIGDISGKLMITDLDYLDRYSAFQRFFHITMGYVSVGMGFTLFTFFSLFFARRTEWDEYLYYCLQLLFGLPILMEVCSFWDIYHSPLLRLKILGLSWVAINVAHPIFLHRIYHLERKWIEQMLWGYLIICIIISIFFTPESMVRFWGMLLILFTWPIGLYNISVNLFAIVNGFRYSKTFGFFGITVVLCALNDGFVYFSKYTGIHLNFFGYQPSVMVFHIGAVFLFMGTSLVLVNRFINVTEQVEDLNASLENFISENTWLTIKLKETQLNTTQQPVRTTSKVEKKLNEVITYINENYLFELSREGLAETAGIHPDNLGKQFKQYTGKKLGDYICELRVNYAAKKLREEDSNIIDIAFDAGFESLRTFNRVFPRFMDMTPVQYRKIHSKQKKA
ncbi:MAG: helix-turn-helix transcriptional regulator [Proteobacteria bacterium]|nr:helix-turn-helix transcriptional regulator [Pseudomonadota bacterium]